MPDAPFDAFRYAHDRYDDVVWMSQNTNHLVPAKVLRPALTKAVEGHRYVDYPYGAGDPELRGLVLKDLDFPSETGWLLAAGGTEALYMLTRALLAPGDEVLASDPSYLIIHKFIGLAGATVVPLDIYGPQYRLTADRLAEARTAKTRLVLLIDPLNPLGSGYPRDEVRAIAEFAHDYHLTLVNDITYRDFSPGHARAAEFAPEETLTVWSVSKNCGLAGLRLGGLAGPPALIGRVARFNTNDLGVNVLAQAAAEAALRTKPQWIDAVRRTTRKNQDRIRDALAPLEGVSLPVFPSHANMFAIDVFETHVTPEALQYELLTRHGVFVRAGNYLSPKFGHRFVRASFSNPPEEIERFNEAFPLALEKLRRTAATARSSGSVSSSA